MLDLSYRITINWVVRSVCRAEICSKINNTNFSADIQPFSENIGWTEEAQAAVCKNTIIFICKY